MTAAGVLVAPALVQVPPGRVGSFVDDVAAVAEGLGRSLEPEQALAVDALTAHDGRGRFLSVEAGVEMPRQNGKTGAVMLPVIVWSALTDPDLYTWTSHLADTHLASFGELADPVDGLVANCDWLRRRVRRVSHENGHEGVTFSNGATLQFRCRSARRGRGKSGNTLFSDEALFLGSESMGAVLPTLATRSLHGNARAYYASSSAKRESAYLRALRRRAVAGDPTLTYVAWWARGSWSVPGCVAEECPHVMGTVGCVLDDEVRWGEANILLGRRTSVEFLRTMRRTLDPVEFGREFMGWQEDGDDAVSVDAWSRLADPGSVPLARPVSLAVDVAPRQRAAAVVAAGRRPDGLLHVELLEHRPGVAWLGEFLRVKQAELGGVAVRHVGGRAPVVAVVPDLVAAGVRRLEVMSDAEFAAACGGFDRLVTDGGLRHLGEARLTVAFAAAVRVDTGDGSWIMSRKGSSGDVCPAVAAVVAVRDLVQQPVYAVAGSVW